MRVLVVEDEKDLNSIICSKLVKEGYNVDACYDGQAALDYMEAENYDGAIMDIMIPNKDGITVLREMRKTDIVKTAVKTARLLKIPKQPKQSA